MSIKLTRLSPGNYTTVIHGKEYDIVQNDCRDTSWFGGWIITSNNSYSDPMLTLRDCRLALQDMNDNPELYGLKKG